MPRKERDEKRRDNKGRLLKSGESQRSDGRYAYKYIDTFGDPQFVYSWKLVFYRIFCTLLDSPQALRQ